MLAVPQSGKSGHRIEIVQIHDAADRFVVISAHHDVSKLAALIDDFVGVGSVADNVAEVDDFIAGRRGCEARLECF